MLSVLDVYTVLLAPGQDEKASVVALAVAEVDVLVAVVVDDEEVVADGETEALNFMSTNHLRWTATVDKALVHLH